MKAFLFLCIYLCFVYTYGLNCQKFIKENCLINANKAVKINFNSSCEMTCQYNETDFIPKLYLKLADFNNVFLTIQQKNFIKSRQLPLELPGNPSPFTSLYEEICPDKDEKLKITISTASKKNTTVKFNIKPIDFILRENGVKLRLTPVIYWAKFYQWQKGEDSVFVSVISRDDDKNVCGIFSVQNASCPLNTNYEMVESGQDKYQTFLKKGGMAVKKSDYPHGIYIVMFSLPDDSKCTGFRETSITKRTKTIYLEVIKANSYTFKEALPSYVILGFVVFFLNSLFVFSARKFIYSFLYSKASDLQELKQSLDQVTFAGSFFSKEQRDPLKNIQQGNNYLAITAGAETNAAEDGIPLVSQNHKNVGFWKKQTYYESPTLQQPKFSFSLTMLLIAGIVLIPVYEMMKNMRQQNQSKKDVCYFNDRCLTSVGYIPDFSRFISNLPFIFCGFFYYIVVQYHSTLSEKTYKYLGSKNHGICRQYFLYKALAFAMVLQGILSMMYHLCPNSTSFINDFFFIYVTVVFLFGVLWTQRHSVASTFTYSPFFSVVFTFFLNEAKYLLSSWFVWLLVGIVHFGIFSIVSIMLVRFGALSLTPVGLKQAFDNEVLRSLNYNFSSLGTLTRCSLEFAINIGIFIWGCITDVNLCYYLLVVLVSNLIFYLFNYLITKKLIKKEKGTKHGGAFIALGILTGIVAVVFFFIKNTNNDVPPAQSRNLSDFCLVGVFSSHDFWHIFSAFSMFLLSIGILTIDDDLILTPSDEIEVF